MDYGKIAYLKTEDIENRLAALDKKSAEIFIKTCNLTKAVNKTFTNISEKADSVTFSSLNNEASVVIYYTFSGSGRANFTVHTNSVFNSQKTFIAEGNSKTVFQIVSAKPDSKGIIYTEISIKAEENLRLSSIEYLILGANAEIIDSGNEIFVAENTAAGNFIIGKIENNRIKSKTCLSSAETLAEDYKTLTAGKSASICPYNNGYGICFTDSLDNLFFGLVSEDNLNFDSLIYIDSGVLTAAVSFSGNIVVMYSKNGKIYYRTVSGNSTGAVNEVKLPCRCIKINAVSNLSRPVFIFTMYDKSNVVKIAEREFILGTECGLIKITCTTEEVT